MNMETIFDYSNRIYKYSKKEKEDKEKNIITETQNIALYEIIRNYFNYIFRSAKFIYDKPVMLHLFSKAGKDVLSNDELINTLESKFN